MNDEEEPKRTSNVYQTNKYKTIDQNIFKIKDHFIIRTSKNDPFYTTLTNDLMLSNLSIEKQKVDLFRNNGGFMYHNEYRQIMRTIYGSTKLIME